MRRVQLHFGVIALVASSTAWSQCGNYSCPPCYYNAPPRPTHNGTVNIAIDSSWNDNTGQPNSVISQGLNDAVLNWNSVNGVSCSLGYTLATTTDATVADVMVYKDDTQGTCASGPLTSIHGAMRYGQDQIRLRSTVANNEASAARTISHELGHILGLDNVPINAPCTATDSIMEEVAPIDTCIDTVHSVTAADGAQVNRNQTSPGSCTVNVYSPPVEPVTSCPSDNGCSGYDINGYPIFNPDFCQYVGGCPSGFQEGAGGGPGNCCEYASSPIIIDVGGDGFELTDAKDGVMFDLTNSGKKQLFSWTAPDVENGWLALERNGDGQINSGAELFGNVTPQPASSHPNGYIALAVYDRPENGGNGNGVIDPGDQIYGSLLIWIDTNHNGISEASELHRLAELGIEAIGLDYTESKWTDQYGNAFRYKARIKIANKPEDHWAYDVFLQTAH